MTIKTLEVIHKLLIENEQRANAEYLAARRLQHEFEDREAPDKGLIERQTAAANELMTGHIKASNALEYFETHEW